MTSRHPKDYQSSKDGRTLLMVVAGRKERGIINNLLHNCPSQKYSENKDLNIVRYVVEDGEANIRLTDKNGKTAYELAKEANNTTIVAYFGELPANNLQDMNSESSTEIENNNNSEISSIFNLEYDDSSRANTGNQNFE